MSTNIAYHRHIIFIIRCAYVRHVAISHVHCRLQVCCVAAYNLSPVLSLDAGDCPPKHTIALNQNSDQATPIVVVPAQLFKSAR